MPEGYIKLTCEDCGGKLVLINAWVPECWLEIDGYATSAAIERMSQMLHDRDKDKPLVLERDVDIKTIAKHYRHTLHCENCGALYERAAEQSLSLGG